MSKLRSQLESNVQPINMDTLTGLIESQLENVVGGGYSQYYCCHYKTVDPKLDGSSPS